MGLLLDLTITATIHATGGGFTAIKYNGRQQNILTFLT